MPIRPKLPRSWNPSKFTTAIASVSIRSRRTTRTRFIWKVTSCDRAATRTATACDVTDLISTYKDMLPEPAHAIRRNHPPESSGFSSERGKFQSGRALWPIRAKRLCFIRWIRFESSAGLTLKMRRPWPSWAMCVVPARIKRPDKFIWRMRFIWREDLLRTRRRSDAQVFRYLPDGKFKIFSVNLGQALAGRCG